VVCFMSPVRCVMSQSVKLVYSYLDNCTGQRLCCVQMLFIVLLLFIDSQYLIVRIKCVSDRGEIHCPCLS